MSHFSHDFTDVWALFLDTTGAGGKICVGLILVCICIMYLVDLGWNPCCPDLTISGLNYRIVLCSSGCSPPWLEAGECDDGQDCLGSKVSVIGLYILSRRHLLMDRYSSLHFALIEIPLWHLHCLIDCTN